MSKRVIGLIGLGMAVQPHARSLIDLGDRIEVRWAYSRSAARCQQFARHFPWPTTTRLDDILDDDQIDAVIILTPPATHLELAADCFNAGKHVLLEKPIAANTLQAEEVVAFAAQRKRNLGIVLQHRFRANSRAL